MKTVQDYIRTIPDFPKPGIMYRDVTTLFGDARGFRMAVDQMIHGFAGRPIDKVAGLEARGFVLGGAIAHQLSVGLVPVRKAGKLPGAVISRAYQLEYGEAVVELHEDAIEAGERVLVVDDLLATGGTARAARKLLPEALFVTLYAKPAAQDLADIFIHEVAQEVWVHFPWDTEDRDGVLAYAAPFAGAES